MQDTADHPDADNSLFVTGTFDGYSYDTEPDTMVLRLRVSVADAKRTLAYRGGRGVLSLEEAKD